MKNKIAMAFEVPTKLVRGSTFYSARATLVKEWWQKMALPQYAQTIRFFEGLGKPLSTREIEILAEEEEDGLNTFLSGDGKEGGFEGLTGLINQSGGLEEESDEKKGRLNRLLYLLNTSAKRRKEGMMGEKQLKCLACKRYARLMKLCIDPTLRKPFHRINPGQFACKKFVYPDE